MTSGWIAAFPIEHFDRNGHDGWSRDSNDRQADHPARLTRRNNRYQHSSVGNWRKSGSGV